MPKKDDGEHRAKLQILLQLLILLPSEEREHLMRVFQAFENPADVAAAINKAISHELHKNAEMMKGITHNESDQPTRSFKN